MKYCICFILLFVSCCIAPLYDKANIQAGRESQVGMIYQNHSVNQIEIYNFDFNATEVYTNLQIMRFDKYITIGNGHSLALIPRLGFGFGVGRTLESNDEFSGWAGYPFFDLGIGLKVNIYSCRTWCISTKYDIGLANIGTLGNLYLLFGIKSNDKEKVTLSLFTNPYLGNLNADRFVGSGLNIAVREFPSRKTTLVGGCNFFFGQDLSRQAEPYIVLWLGISL